MPVHTFTIHKEYHKKMLPFIGYIFGYENYKNLTKINLSSNDCPHIKGFLKFLRSINEMLSDCPINNLKVSLIPERNMFSVSLAVNPYYLATNDVLINLFTEEYLEVLPFKFAEFLEAITILPPEVLSSEVLPSEDYHGYYNDFLDFYKWKIGEVHATYDFYPSIPASYSLKLLYRSFRPFRGENITAVTNEDNREYRYITVKNKSVRVSFYDKYRYCLDKNKPPNVIDSSEGILRYEVQLFNVKVNRCWNDYTKNNKRLKKDNRKRTEYLLSDMFTFDILTSYYERYFPTKPWHSLDRSKSIISKSNVSDTIKELSKAIMALIRLHNGTKNAVCYYHDKKPFLKAYDDIQNRIGIAPYSIPCRDYASLGLKNTAEKCVASPYQTLKKHSETRPSPRDIA